jgi:hypothetical protein
VTEQQQPPAGWYPDPHDASKQRYWDGTQWTVEAPPGAATTAVPEKKRGRGCLWGLIAAAAVVVLIIIVSAVALTNAADKIEKTQAKAKKEVTITTCDAPNAIGVVYANGEARNTSSQASTYLIQVTVVSPDGTQIGRGSTTVDNVEAGQTAEWKALTDTGSRWIGGSQCKVAKVTRLAS